MALYWLLKASRTVPLPVMVFLMPMPWAVSWNITLEKKASNLMCSIDSGVISSRAMGSRILSNLACMEFFSCSLRVPRCSSAVMLMRPLSCSFMKSMPMAPVMTGTSERMKRAAKKRRVASLWWRHQRRRLA